jgi:hypothetical protein
MTRYSIIVFSVIAGCLAQPAFAQKLVDPSTVAPEYREAAMKRRAEQLRQRECAHKADTDKILPRDRTAYLNRCLDETER